MSEQEGLIRNSKTIEEMVKRTEEFRRLVSRDPNRIDYAAVSWCDGIMFAVETIQKMKL